MGTENRPIGPEKGKIEKADFGNKAAFNENYSMEAVALRYSGRGMDALRPFLSENFYHEAASRLLALKNHTILLTTGFYVGGVCETDGPPGTFCMVKTLQNFGYNPVIVTDEFCIGLFDELRIPVVYAPLKADDIYWQQLLQKWKPAGMISIERCGKNQDGEYANMRGQSISPYTAPIDRLFELAADMGIYTIGIGDGGNEIGMGNRKEELRKLTKLNPCVVRTADLLIATTSNWGAYALSASLVREMKCRCSESEYDKYSAALPEYRQIADYISFMAGQGCVDGTTRIVRNWVDGFPPETEEEIYRELMTCSERGC